jgi:cellulase/cellobiase CelA1
MRYTKREQLFAVAAGVLAVAVAVLLGFALFRGPSRPATTPAPAAPPHPSTPPRSTPAGPPSALRAEYAVRGRWPGGFNAELVVTNLGSQPIEGWTVRLRLPPDIKVGQAWSADVTRAPDAVVLRSQPWNTYLGPGATIRMGFEATGPPAQPTSCTVNGSPC